MTTTFITRLRPVWLLAGLAALALTASACGGAGAAQTAPTSSDQAIKASGKVGDEFNIAIGYPPVTLDPGLADRNPGFIWYTELAYEPLIREGADGKLSPALATSWKYTDSSKLHFVLTIRPGVKFADGTPVTAQAVANSLNYSRSQKGSNPATWLSSVKSVTADGDTVKIEQSSPNPLLPMLLTQNRQQGDIISPAGLKDPKALGTKTFGAGPYVLDPSATVTGDHYTYTPNPNYWNKSGQHWKRVSIKVIPNITSAIQALKTGQADLTFTIDVAGVAGAASSNIIVYNAPGGVQGVDFFDRNGQLSKPLANVKVRQALNYAIDRKTITQGLFQQYGKPTWQITTPGNDAYNPALENAYPYDPNRAKQLLQQAGYGNGLTLNMETQGFLGTDKVAQAVIGDWQKVGVNVKLTSDATFDNWSANILGKKFPVGTFAFGAAPMYLIDPAMFQGPTVFNPWGLKPKEINDLVAKGNVASGAEQTQLYQQAMKIASDQAFYAPVAETNVMFPASTKLAGVSVTSANIIPDVATIAPAQ